MEYVGRSVKKEFKGFGIFNGTVKSYDEASGFFEIKYEDGDSEEVDLSEIIFLLDGDGNGKGGEVQSAATDLTRGPSGIGGKPKKRRRIEKGNSGNDSGDSGNLPVQIGEGFGKTLDRSKTLENGGLNLNLNIKEEERDDRIQLKGKRLNLDLNDGFNLNDGDERVELDLNLNGVLDLNRIVDLSVVEGNVNKTEDHSFSRSEFIDLNVDANEYNNNDINHPRRDDLSPESKKQRGHFFDLNLGLDDEAKIINDNRNGEWKENTIGHVGEKNWELGVSGDFEGVCYDNLEETPVKQCYGLTEDELKNGILKEIEVQVVGPSDTGAIRVDWENGGSAGAPKGRPGRRKRKLADSSNSVPQTVLRRSTRKSRRESLPAEDHVSSLIGSDAVNDLLSSPAVSALSEEKVMESAPEESEECDILPPMLELPPSSDNLKLDGISVLDIFSVYSFLRSFSTLLYLSPFELEDFVASIRSSAPCLLFDSIHVSLLQTLRKHLESVTNDGSECACDCLRFLNWDLLDLITWPIFMVEYFLMHGSGLKPEFDLCQLKLFESDYYKQPASVKILILQSLCDDVIEVESIKSELNRRTMVNEPNMDFDRNVKLVSSKKRNTATDVTTFSTEEEVDETADWNSDECCLCKMDGNLICCDGCPAAFHSRCVGVASSLLPEGDWYCPECMINKDKPWMKMDKSIRGAELLGIDPYGRLYYACCGYLLVSDSCDKEVSLRYYHRNDVPTVAEALKSSEIVYGNILTAILNLWDVASASRDGVAKSDFNTGTHSESSDFLLNGQGPAMPLPSGISETCTMDEIANEAKTEEQTTMHFYNGDVGCEKPGTMKHSAKMVDGLSASEGSAEVLQTMSATRSNRRTGASGESKISGQHPTVGECIPTSICLEVEHKKDIHSANNEQASLETDTRKVASQGQCENYVNHYNFARIASSVIEELMSNSAEKSVENVMKSVEEIISSQLKAIANRSNEFYWPNIQVLNSYIRKEKCGWCIWCKVPEEERDCLFIMNDHGPAPKSFTSEILGICSRKNRKGHFIDVMCHILSIESRLHGLLLGPWLNMHYSEVWRKSLASASDIAAVKSLLLMLESNLHHLALSPDWLKHMDSSTTVGSASHFMTSSSRMSSRNGMGKKRGRCSEIETSSSSHAGSGLTLFWWRGGRISRQLFNWKVLPRSLVAKAARQGGCKKIAGVLYPDNSEFARRSKNMAWRAAVETCRSVEQLALQVREFHANIRWDDIENTSLQSKIDKEAQKPVRSFKKVIVRRKCSEGTVVKYLLDFGKRRFLPDIVVKYGSKLEECSSERKRYWLEESYVPLHLLKGFEEKRIARRSSKISSGKLRERKRAVKKQIKRKSFDYLFARAEKSENYQCGLCNKDVPIREAVSCQFCQGFFHKRHVKRSTGALATGCIYTCHKCHNGKHVKIVKKGKPPPQKSKKSSKVSRPSPSKIRRKGGKDKQKPQAQKGKKKPVVVPLRRSARMAKIEALKNQKVGRKKKKMKQTKSRKGTSKKSKESAWQKKRSKLYHSYWLNGLQFSEKPNDDRVMHFRGKKLLVLSSELTPLADQPTCTLCGELESTSALHYISCEVCGDWFHGDAFNLKAERVGSLIGFKCHACLSRTPPTCPHMQLGGLKNDVEVGSAENFLGRQACSGIERDEKQASDADPHLNQHAEFCTENGGFLVPTSEKQRGVNNSSKTDARLQTDSEVTNGLVDNSRMKDETLGDEFMVSNEKTPVDKDEIESGETTRGEDAMMIDQESGLSNCKVDIKEAEVTSLMPNHMHNGLAMQASILGSVVKQALVGSCELPPQVIIASGELSDGSDKNID